MFVQIGDDEYINLGCIRHAYKGVLDNCWHVEMADGDEYEVSVEYVESFLAAIEQMLMPAELEVSEM